MRDDNDGKRSMMMIGGKEGKEEVKKERTDLQYTYLKKRSKRNALFQLRFDLFIDSHHR